MSLEKGHLRQLRHDFRRYYSVGYDDVSISEAIDLIYTLPAGSMYISAIDPVRSWSVEDHRSADIRDAIYQAICIMRGIDPSNAPKVIRPEDVERQRRAVEAARKARAIIESTTWEAVL